MRPRSLLLVLATFALPSAAFATDTCAFSDPCNGAFVEAESDADLVDACGRPYYLDASCDLFPADPNLCPVFDACEQRTEFRLVGSTFVDDCRSVYRIQSDCSLDATYCVYTDACNGHNIIGYPDNTFTDSCGDTYTVYDNCSVVDPQQPQAEPPMNPHLSWGCGAFCDPHDWDCDGEQSCGAFDADCYDDSTPQDHATPDSVGGSCAGTLCVDFEYTYTHSFDISVEYSLESDNLGYAYSMDAGGGVYVNVDYQYYVEDGTTYIRYYYQRDHRFELEAGSYGYGYGTGWSHGYSYDYARDYAYGYTLIVYPDGTQFYDWDIEEELCIEYDVAGFGYGHDWGYGYSNGYNVDQSTDIEYQHTIGPDGVDIHREVNLEHDVCLYGWRSWGYDWGWDSQWAERCTPDYDPDDCSVFDWTCGVDPADACEIFDWACSWEDRDPEGWHGGGYSWVWDWSLDLDLRYDISIDPDRCADGECAEDAIHDCERGVTSTLMTPQLPNGLRLAAAYHSDGIRGYVEGMTPGAQAMLFLGDENFNSAACDWYNASACDLTDAEPLLTLSADVAGIAAFAIPSALEAGSTATLQVIEMRVEGPTASNPERIENLGDQARLRWVHSDPHHGSVEVLVDGELHAMVEPSGSVELNLEPGERMVEIRGTNGVSLSTSMLDLRRENTYTAVSSMLTAPLEAVRDDWGVVDVTAARVRLINDVGEEVRVDVDLDGVYDLVVDAAVDSIHDHGYRMAANANHVVGVEVGGRAPVRFTLPYTHAGDEVVIHVTGDPTLHPSMPDALRLTLLHRDDVVETVLQDPVVRMVHTDPVADAFKVSLGGDVESVYFGEISEAMWGRAGTNPLVVDGRTLDIVSLEAGQRYLTTSMAEGSALMITEPAASDTRILLANVAHTSQSNQDIGPILRSGFDVAVAGLIYGDTTSSNGIPVSPGSYRIGVAESGDTVHTDVDVTLEPDSRNILLVDGDGTVLQIRTDGDVWTARALQ